VTGTILEKLGVHTIGQVRALSVDILHRHFGQSGDHLWQLAHGIDPRAVVSDRDAKSISHESTFPADIVDRDVLRGWLMDLTEQVGWRLRRHKLRGRTVQIKVRFADFRTITRSKTLPESTDITRELWREAALLLDACLSSERRPIRLLGVGISGLKDAEPVQKTLFADDSRNKLAELDQAADRIRERFGKSALSRGSSLGDAE
jgi:DNA polymerase-4